MERRIDTTTSRTAELTCISRAFSVMEKNQYYKSDDYIAPLLLPSWFKAIIQFPFARRLFTRVLAPKGIYEYVIYRTKYIDYVFKQALSQNFDQILIFGAGFDISSIANDELTSYDENDAWEAREVHFKDKISKKMILTIFPRRPHHLTEGKKKKEIDKKNEYPLIKRQCMYEGYKLIVEKTINWTLSKARRYSEEWREILATYFNSINKNQRFLLEQFCNELECEIGKDRIIMAFLENVGAVRCFK